MEVRSRLVARDFRGGDKDRDDLFTETPPLEGKRMLMSRAVTRGLKRKGVRKLTFIDARKAHLNPKCEGDVYIELPKECGYGGDVWEVELLVVRIQARRVGVGKLVCKQTRGSWILHGRWVWSSFLL